MSMYSENYAVLRFLCYVLPKANPKAVDGIHESMSSFIYKSRIH